MIKNVCFTAGLFLLALAAAAQAGQLNQFDSKGKKDGKWLLWLDKDWKITGDSSKAIFSRYTYYDHGTDVYSMGAFGGKWRLAESAKTNGRVQLLDGEYKWVDKNGHTGFILVLKAGEFVSYKAFYKSGALHEHFDYTKKWLGQPLSYNMKIYNDKGEYQSYFMFKGGSGWMGYASNADSTAMEISKLDGDSTFSTTHFYRSGKLIRLTEEVTVKANGHTETMYHGAAVSWYLNGQKKEEGRYVFGTKTSEWKHWDENGNEIFPATARHTP